MGGNSAAVAAECPCVVEEGVGVIVDVAWGQCTDRRIRSEAEDDCSVGV